MAKNPNAEFEKLLDAAKKARTPHDREAWLNLAFFLDKQYVEWYQENPRQDPVFRVIPRDGSEDRRPRPQFNKIMHYTREAHASVLQDDPQGDVLPATDDITDISDALVAKAWIDDQSDATNVDFEEQLSTAALWALIAPLGWLKWVWNPTYKRLDVIPTSYFEVYPDPYARRWKDCRYVIHSQFMDKEQVYELYGVEVSPGEVQSADRLKAELMQGMGSAPVLEGVTVNELWHKPSRRHPNGLYVVWAGNRQLAYKERLPYDVLRRERKLPFTPLGCIKRPDSLFCMSPISFLRSPQMTFNKYHAQRIIMRDKFANMKWWIPDELQLNEDPDDRPDQILRGHSAIPGMKPELIMPPTQMPSAEGDVIETQMMHLVGQHEVSQAQVPGRVEAAKAIEMLLNQDANALSNLRKTIKSAHSEGWYMALCYAQQFEDPNKMVMAYSREGVPEVKRFRAKDLKPGFRIRTTMTTGLAATRAARQDQLMRMWDAKVITDRQIMAELMDLPLPSVMSEKAEDVKVARNENYDMADGNARTASSWDDHTIHLREHNRYRKSHEFRMLPTRTKEKFEMHCDQHENLQRIELSKQAELALIAQGGQPGGPPPNPSTSPPMDNTTASSEQRDQSDNQRPAQEAA